MINKLDNRETLFYYAYLALGCMAIFFAAYALFTIKGLIIQDTFIDKIDGFFSIALTIIMILLVAGTFLLLTAYKIYASHKDYKFTGMAGCISLAAYPVFHIMAYKFETGLLLVVIPTLALIALTVKYWKKQD